MRWSRRSPAIVASSALLASSLLLLAAAPQTAVPPPASVPQPATSAPQAPPQPLPQPPAPEQAAVAAEHHPRFLVVIDPAHGGEETGVVFDSKLLEKDLTLSLARRLRAELANRGIAAVLLRDGDFAIPSDQRATAANADRPSLYVALHAGMPGTSVRVYTAMLASSRERRGSFQPWQTAQAAYVEASTAIAGRVTRELAGHDIEAAALPGPILPLNSIAAPAVAVEASPPDDDPATLGTAKYQQNLASALAAAIAGERPAGEANR